VEIAVAVALVEDELFEQEPAVHESSVRIKTGRFSPFDAQTRRVDLEEVAKSLDERAASSSRTR